MTTSRFRLSVTLPNYNHGAFVARAIEAVLSQSRPPDEFIILDDGSTDGSPEVILPYAKKYPFIRYIPLQKNAGYFNAIQMMSAHVTGDYVLRASADDYVLPGFFEEAMRIAQAHPEAGLILGKMVVRNERGIPLTTLGSSIWNSTRYVSPQAFLVEFFRKENPSFALGAATIYRQKSLEAVGGIRTELDSLWDTFAMRTIGLKDGVCYLHQDCAVWWMLGRGMCQEALLDPRRMALLVDKTAALMRSDEFRSVYPETDVKRWEKGYKHFVMRTNHPLVRMILKAGAQFKVPKAFAGVSPFLVKGLRSWVTRP